MSITAYADLIQRLEPEAVKNPTAYKRRVIGLALFGNAYVTVCFLILASLAVVAALSVAILKVLGLQLLLLFGGAFLLAVRALWVKLPDPRGLRIRQHEAPDLFKLVEELRAKLNAPAFDHILLSNEFNASVIQVPRFGLFGGTRNFLTIGLPLLKGTTELQTRAILAHEFGHLARNHAKLGSWVYHQRLRWARLAYAFDQQGQSGGVLFTPFLKRFLPYFNAYSFPLARANEYEADATSAALTDPVTTAEALTAVHAVTRFLESHYWPNIYNRASFEEKPQATPLQDMPENLGLISNEQWQQWINDAMIEASGISDTHPVLRERLAALGQAPQLNLPSQHNRADRLLGSFNDVMSREYDQDWLREATPSWHQRYAEAEQQRLRLDDLNIQANEGVLEPELALERALLTETVVNNHADALQQFDTLVDLNPNYAIAHYHYGIRLLPTNTKIAETLISKAMQLDEDLTLPIAERLSVFYRQLGDSQAALKWQRTYEQRSELEYNASRERQQINSRDKFDRHDLSQEAVNTIRAQLKSCKGIHKAYFVRKRLKALSHRAQYVLAIRITPFYRLHNEQRGLKAAHEVLNKVTGLPAGTIVFCADGENIHFTSRFRWMRGSRIF